MKKIILYILTLGISVLNLSAQRGEKVCGIYRSAENFISGNVSFAGQKIRLNDFFNKGYLTIKSNNLCYNLSKNDVYGYIKCDKKIFRFYNRKELLLLNPGESILIFKELHTKVHQGARINITNCYFSIGGFGNVQVLTKKKLEAAFPENEKFRALIDKNFKYNTDLAKFDDENKVYKINLILQETQ